MARNQGATPVLREKFFAIAHEVGIPVEELKSWFKLKGPGGQRVYVPKTKNVTRIDISGFEVQFGAKVPDQGVFGGVKQQLDMALPEAEVLENFKALLLVLKELPPPPKPEAKSRAKSAPQAGDDSSPGEVPSSPDSLQADQLRIARIREYAEKTGMPISKNSIASAAE